MIPSPRLSAGTVGQRGLRPSTWTALNQGACTEPLGYSPRDCVHRIPRCLIRGYGSTDVSKQKGSIGEQILVRWES